MNKFLITAAVISLAFGVQAKHPSPVNTVLEVLTLQDDAPVVLQGKIDKPLKKGKYQFSDNTGTIVLDIDDEVIGNMQILSEEMVEIHGEVDKGWFSTEIDVEEIVKN